MESLAFELDDLDDLVADQARQQIELLAAIHGPPFDLGHDIIDDNNRHSHCLQDWGWMARRQEIDYDTRIEGECTVFISEAA